MENAQMLDHRLRKIIREISGDTGAEIKQHLAQELALALQQNQGQQTRLLLNALNQALKNIN